MFRRVIIKIIVIVSIKICGVALCRLLVLDSFEDLMWVQPLSSKKSMLYTTVKKEDMMVGTG